MPVSKNKPHHPVPHHQQHHTEAEHGMSRAHRNLLIATTLLFFILGLGIGYFLGGDSYIWPIVTGIAGAVAGYYFGQSIQKAVVKK